MLWQVTIGKDILLFSNNIALQLISNLKVKVVKSCVQLSHYGIKAKRALLTVCKMDLTVAVENDHFTPKNEWE